MNPTLILEVIIDGALKHKIGIQRDGIGSIVNGNFISNGKYFFKTEDIKNIVQKKAKRDYYNQKIEIKYK